ncbi:MAG: NAD-dependent epimerase/dehydratase family protein [Candidatus Marinimicrobia bacterium]|nr:NAD-dependent epimerase/dehydratase family protein [Candidatus Neomarinimicrobiota bacterium]
MKQKRVLITGGTGYLGSWIIQIFAENGWEICTTVRKNTAPENLTVLEEITQSTGVNIDIKYADLLTPNSFDDAVKNMDVVVHSASPFVAFGTKNPQKELIDPAVIGTQNVLQSVAKAGVKKVVLTSSIAAMYGDGREAEGKIIDESFWNKASSVTYRPYEYSKTMAENKAWELAKAHSIDLVTINPGFILGPALTSRQDSSSIEIMNDFVNGKYKTGIPDTSIGIVDVRDVAKAHFLATENSNIEGRIIICAKAIKFIEMANAIRKKVGDSEPVPKSLVPKYLFWLLSPLFGIERAYVLGNVGFHFDISNEKSKKDLQIEYRDWEETVAEHYQQLKAQ